MAVLPISWSVVISPVSSLLLSKIRSPPLPLACRRARDPRHQIRIRPQLEDGQSAQPRRSYVNAIARRRGDRISDVRYWHLADIEGLPPNVCYWGERGHRDLTPYVRF